MVITFNGKIDEIKGKGAGAVENFNYYADGISYYKIMIKHDDTDKALNELGEFGVVRNSVYDINVNKFNNPISEIPTPVLIPMRRTALFWRSRLMSIHGLGTLRKKNFKKRIINFNSLFLR